MDNTFELTYNGKKHLAAVNVVAARTYAKEKDLKYIQDIPKGFVFDGKQDEMPLDVFDNISLFLFFALKEGARISGKEFALTHEDAMLIMGENAEVLKNLRERLQGEEDEDEEKENPPMPRAKKKK